MCSSGMNVAAINSIRTDQNRTRDGMCRVVSCRVGQHQVRVYTSKQVCLCVCVCTLHYNNKVYWPVIVLSAQVSRKQSDVSCVVLADC